MTKMRIGNSNLKQMANPENAMERRWRVAACSGWSDTYARPRNTWPVACTTLSPAEPSLPVLGRRVIASRSQSATLDVPATSDVDYCCIPRYDFTLALCAVAHSQGCTLPSHPPSGNSPSIAAALGGPEQVLEVGSLCRACRIMGQF
jgi:hypothetical protein